MEQLIHDSKQRGTSVSGRWLTIIAVSGCVALVAFALWQRSRTTEHVRQFWGANQAHLIQHGANVKLRAGEQEWIDVSHAPGLVHLRATLVDDRYFQWKDMKVADEFAKDTDYILHFEQSDQAIELRIDPQMGHVTNLQSQQSVPLISASRQAVAAYLKEIDHQPLSQ